MIVIQSQAKHKVNSELTDTHTDENQTLGRQRRNTEKLENRS